MAVRRRYGAAVAALLWAVVGVGGIPDQGSATPRAVAATLRSAGPRIGVPGPTVRPARPAVGARVVVTGRMPGHRRPVVLMVDGKPRAQGRTTWHGSYRLRFRAPFHATTVEVKVGAPHVRRLRAATTAPRVVPVVVPSTPCRALRSGATTWSAGPERRFDCTVRVPVGSTLTLGPGAIVHFGRGAGIDVAGHLVLAGTAARPVRLDAATPARWTGLASNGDGSIDVTHAVIDDAQTAVDTESGVADPHGHTLVTRSRFRRDGAGVVVQSSDPRVWTLRATVTHNDFGGLARGVFIEGAVDPVVANNSFHDLSDTPLVLTESVMDLDLLHGNSGFGNAVNIWVLESNDIHAGGTLAMGSPSLGPGRRSAPRPLMPVVRQRGLVTYPGVTVRIGAGVVKFDGNPTHAWGDLDIEGTAAAPAILTSVKDSSVGDFSGVVGPPTAGDWLGFTTGGPATVNHARLLYATYALWPTGGGPVALDDVVFLHDETGVASNGGPVSMTDVVFTQVAAALVLDNGGSVQLTRVQFTDTARAIVAYSGGASCTAPYAPSTVIGDDVWFGVSGGPGGLSALATATDPGSGDASYDQAKAAYDDAVSRYGAYDDAVTDNTIAFADWACADYSFPVTLVHVGIAASPPFPAYAEVTSQ